MHGVVKVCLYVSEECAASVARMTESGVGECRSSCEQPLTKKLVVKTCTIHKSSSLGPEIFLHKNYISRL